VKPSQFLVPCALGTLSLVVRRTWRESAHSLPTSTDVINSEAMRPLPPHLHNLNLGLLHPVACVRSGDGALFRLRNVTIVA
jgi:hypothetical protein